MNFLRDMHVMAADEVAISKEPATTDEVSPQKTVIEVPKETARKRRATPPRANVR